MRSHPHIPHPDTLITPLQRKAFEAGMVDRMATVLGSVGFIYVCFVLDLFGLAGLAYQIYTTLTQHLALLPLLLNIFLAIAVFLSQTVIQLVALPVLQNYQNRQATTDGAKKAADHQALTHIAFGQDDIANAMNLDTEGGLRVLDGKLDEILTHVRRPTRSKGAAV